MAKTSSVSIAVTVLGDGETSSYAPPASPVTNTAAPHGGTVTSVLAAGANTITLPAGAIGVCIVPPTTSTNAKTLKGVAGDTGFLMLASRPLVLYFDPTVTAFDLNSAGIETLVLHWL